MPQKNTFVHLHNHTEHSLLDGASRISDMIAVAKKEGMEALAITDHGVMYGVIPFVEEALREGIKPIIGVEFYLSPRSRFDRNNPKEESNYHLLLLAENNEGYRNLMKLVTKSYFDGYYYKPRVDKELLGMYSKGLIALTACMKGEIPESLIKGDHKKARELVAEYLSIFGEGNLYLELQDQGIPEQKIINEGLMEISRTMGVPVVATNDVHYTHREDFRAHDVLLCIQTNSTLDQPDRLRFSSDQFFLKSAEEMRDLFSWAPEALDNTLEIAERCNVDIALDRYLIPRYQVPEGYDADSYLEKLAFEGLSRVYPQVTPEIRQRLEYELSVIKDMDFSGYFLIVWDFVKHAKERGIMVGPGRGSAAGSIVAYALGITTVDPIKYGLLFERFLNPSRKTMPDMDIDFCYRRRQEVIEYVTEKYGSDRVAQIITFSTMAARAAIKDAGRVFNVEYGKMDKIAKMVPEELNITIEKALSKSPELRQIYEEDQVIKEVIDTALKLEGLTRQDSIHAAGVVIADDDLSNYTPVQKKGSKEIVTQFDMAAIQKIGLLKMDFLGLRTLTVLDDTKRNIKINRNVELDFEKIPMDDPLTFELLQRGDTIGVFQLESSGMRALIRDLKPSCFEDLIALLALYRPGPLGSGMVQDFVNRKHGKARIHYPHPDLEHILKETYGIIVYQEQVMRLAVEMAGYSMAEADILRGAIAKSKWQVVEEQRHKFVEGAVSKGYERKLAEEIFDLIRNFGLYGFNKSHSTAYAFISYQTAYAKAHYPVEFMAALLTSISDNKDKVRRFIGECRRMGIKVLPPDINESNSEFTPVRDSLRFGLSAIRNLGTGAIAGIIQEREINGPFKSLLDFCDRVDSSVLNKKTLESLIKSGAFDSFGLTRNHMLKAYDTVAEIAMDKKRLRGEGQFSLFEGEEALQLPEMEEITEELPRDQLLSYEKEMLGLYVTDHPLMQFKSILSKYIDCDIERLAECEDGDIKWVGGIINKVTKVLTRKGDIMARIILEDLTGEVEVTIFPQTFAQFKDIIMEDLVLCVKGKVELREEQVKMTALEVTTPNLKNPDEKTLVIKMSLPFAKEEILERLKEAIRSHPGPNRVQIHLLSGRKITILKLDENFKVNPDSALFAEIRSLLGEKSVSLQ